MSTRRKLGEYRVIHQPIFVVSQRLLMPGCRTGLQRSVPTYGKRECIRGALQRCAVQFTLTNIKHAMVGQHSIIIRNRTILC